MNGHIVYGLLGCVIGVMIFGNFGTTVTVIGCICAVAVVAYPLK